MTRVLTGLACAAVLVAAPAAQAAPTVAFPHFGRLLDKNDQPVDGTRQLTFRIYDAATGGTKVWEGAYSVSLSANGVYAITLGDAEHPIDPAKLTGGDRWLGISVEGAPEFSPRQQFGTVLYAVEALNATNLKGGTIDGATIRNSTLDAPTITGGSISGVTLDQATITGGSLANVSIDHANITASSANITGGTISGVTVEATSLKAAAIELNGQPVGANSVAKTGDTMTGSLTAPSFISTTTSGAPLTVASSVVVPNLNASLLGGHAGGDFVLKTDVRSDNLAHNGAFENFLHGTSVAPNWFASQAAFSPSNGGISQVTGLSGNAVQLSDRDPAGRVVLKQVVIPAATAGLAGRTYQASVSFKLTFSSARGLLCLADAGADNAETAKDCTVLTGSSSWQRATVTHVMSASPSYLKVYFSATSADPTEGADYVFDDLAVVEGDGSAAFVANPEDAFAGMITAFARACPTGWTEYTAARGRFLRGEPNGDAGALDVGGSDDEVVVAHTHRVTGITTADGAHTHNVSGSTSTDGAHQHQVGVSGADDNNHTGNGDFVADSDAGYKGFGRNTTVNGAHAHTFNVTSGSGGAHSHTIDFNSQSTGVSGVGRNMPAFQEMIFCQKE